MSDYPPDGAEAPEPQSLEPSGWVIRFTRLIRPRGAVLDVAAGQGRHCQWFLDGEYTVVAIDRDLTQLSWLEHPALVKQEADLEEDAAGWPLGDRAFDAVVVTNYLWRNIFDDIVNAVRHDGVLIYETFAEGNERYGRPRRPEFLLQPGELLARVAPRMEIVAYEHGYSEHPSPRVVQRICAIGRGRRLSQCPLGAA
ncbi:MAG TPA: methyltransferase domain-containing protein [Polyangiaceae bacterium]|jgi:SAM-dependent methyltransferase|nr:methyltransferase domain-containing protein [Polyangiaceae bacterium]